MIDNKRRYPAVEVSEIIAMIQSLPTTLEDVSDTCNYPVVYLLQENEDPALAESKGWIIVTDNMVMYTCMLTLFNAIYDGDHTWADYPAWMKEVYDRASICEIWDQDIEAGIILTREMFDQWEADQAPVDLDPDLAAELLQLL